MQDGIDTAVLHEQNINNLFVLVVVHLPQEANAQTMAQMYAWRNVIQNLRRRASDLKRALDENATDLRSIPD